MLGCWQVCVCLHTLLSDIFEVHNKGVVCSRCSQQCQHSLHSVHVLRDVILGDACSPCTTCSCFMRCPSWQCDIAPLTLHPGHGPALLLKHSCQVQGLQEVASMFTHYTPVWAVLATSSCLLSLWLNIPILSLLEQLHSCGDTILIPWSESCCCS